MDGERRKNRTHAPKNRKIGENRKIEKSKNRKIEKSKNRKSKIENSNAFPGLYKNLAMIPIFTYFFLIAKTPQKKLKS
jgi:hypothetical protein